MWILVAIAIATLLLSIVTVALVNKTIKDKRKMNVKRHIIKAYTKAYAKVVMKDNIKLHIVKDIKAHGRLMDFYHGGN